jgi:transcriptional regulator with XRE-family HTH domain
MKFQDKVGLRIAQLRNDKNLSQQKLAYEANIERTHLTHIEKGRKNISLSTLDKLINALDIKPKDFFDSDIFKNESVS